MEMRVILVHLFKDYNLVLNDESPYADRNRVRGVNRGTMGPLDLLNNDGLARTAMFLKVERRSN